ncbi:LytR/AlgR family response regulator transcription factor [Spirosoma flavum]|uniref:LytR/AlgR family response regulator transcription factor n=1 Tax=Spirosoma flavum TaxID=2048557 RepID=A0ABW6AE65_9BACT
MDILYIEADRNYSRIFTREKEYLLSVTFKNIEEKLPQPFFMRIHCSYIVVCLNWMPLINTYNGLYRCL